MLVTDGSGHEDHSVIAQERALLNRVREGDGHAFTELVTQYLDTVTRFAFYLIGSYDAAEDLAQSVFVSLWERRNALDEVQSLKSYLFRSIRNRAFDEQKSNLVRERYRAAVHAEVESGTLEGSVANLEDSMLTTATVQAAISELPERRQLVLRLRIEDELTHAEIGEILDISPQAAQVLAGRALADLRKKLRVFD